MKPLRTPRQQQRRSRWFVSVACGAVFLSCGVWFARTALPAARFERARESVRAGSFEGVRYELASIDRRPQFETRAALLRAWLLLNETTSEQGKEARHKAAWADLTLAVDDDECRALALALMGRVLYEQEHLAEALQLLEQALREGPKEAEAYRWLGIAAYDIGDTVVAMDYLQRLAELEPANGLPHRLIGIMLKEKGEFAAAAAAYEISLTRGADHRRAGEVRYDLAECRFFQHNYEGALAALQRCSDSAEVLVLRGECYHAQARSQLAGECADRALQQQPEMPEALALKGKMCSEARNEKEAVEWLERAVEQKPNDFHLHYQLLQSYQRLGKEELARAEAKRIEQLQRMADDLDKLLEEADRRVADAEIRYRIAELASQLDMPELARNWAKAGRLVERAAPVQRGISP